MGGSTTQVTKNETDPDIKRRLLEVNDRARVIADSPFQAYTAARVAEISPTQNYVRGLLQNVVDDKIGAAALDNSRGIFDKLSNYGAPEITAPASLVAQQVNSPGTLTAGNLNSPGTLGYSDISVPQVLAGQLKDTDLSAYMNPYTQNVIDASIADLETARLKQRLADSQSASLQARAFGNSSRQGVADSLTNNAFAQAAARTTADLRSAGYQNAQAMALADIANRYGAEALNANNALTANQFNATNRLNTDRYNLDAQTARDQFNINNRFGADRYNLDTINTNNIYNANARTLADQFNINTGLDVQKANAANDIVGANIRANAGQALAGISDQELQQALQRAGALAAFGDLEYDISQRKLEADFAEFMRQQNDPLIKQQILQGSATVLPNDGTQTTTTKQSPGLGSILGSIASVGLDIGSLGTGTIAGSLLGLGGSAGGGIGRPMTK